MLDENLLSLNIKRNASQEYFTVNKFLMIKRVNLKPEPVKMVPW
jgi:hypothetical protein